MLVFCIIYCRDNIYDISLFGKFLPSNSKPNKFNFYAYNLFGVIWCWFEWEQAISMCFHTFDRDKYIKGAKMIHLSWNLSNTSLNCLIISCLTWSDLSSACWQGTGVCTVDMLTMHNTGPLHFLCIVTLYARRNMSQNVTIVTSAESVMLPKSLCSEAKTRGYCIFTWYQHPWGRGYY